MVKLIILTPILLFSGLSENADGLKVSCQLTVDPDNGFYSCIASISDFANPGIFERISGLNLPGKTNADVKGFNMKGQTGLTAFPTGLSNWFKNIEELNAIDTEYFVRS